MANLIHYTVTLRNSRAVLSVQTNSVHFVQEGKGIIPDDGATSRGWTRGTLVQHGFVNLRNTNNSLLPPSPPKKNLPPTCFTEPA